LSSALRRFRLLDQKRALWADATCINQADIKERDFQVTFMSRIYSSARQVHTWLGEESVEAARAEELSRIDKILPTPPRESITKLHEYLTPHLSRNLARQIGRSSWQQIGCLLRKP
jgi:hypothetical protein